MLQWTRAQMPLPPSAFILSDIHPEVDWWSHRGSIFNFLRNLHTGTQIILNRDTWSLKNNGDSPHPHWSSLGPVLTTYYIVNMFHISRLCHLILTNLGSRYPYSHLCLKKVRLRGVSQFAYWYKAGMGQFSSS